MQSFSLFNCISPSSTNAYSVNVQLFISASVLVLLVTAVYCKLILGLNCCSFLLGNTINAVFAHHEAKYGRHGSSLVLVKLRLSYAKHFFLPARCLIWARRCLRYAFYVNRFLCFILVTLGVIFNAQFLASFPPYEIEDLQELFSGHSEIRMSTIHLSGPTILSDFSHWSKYLSEQYSLESFGFLTGLFIVCDHYARYCLANLSCKYSFLALLFPSFAFLLIIIVCSEPLTVLISIIFLINMLVWYRYQKGGKEDSLLRVISFFFSISLTYFFLGYSIKILVQFVTDVSNGMSILGLSGNANLVAAMLFLVLACCSLITFVLSVRTLHEKFLSYINTLRICAARGRGPSVTLENNLFIYVVLAVFVYAVYDFILHLYHFFAAILCLFFPGFLAPPLNFISIFILIYKIMWVFLNYAVGGCAFVISLITLFFSLIGLLLHTLVAFLGLSFDILGVFFYTTPEFNLIAQPLLLFSIVFLPLLNAVLLGFFGFLFSLDTVLFFVFFCMGTSVLFSLIILMQFYSVFYSSLSLPNSLDYGYLETTLCDSVEFFKWLQFTGFNDLNWLFVFDGLSITMLVIVSVVSFLVHQYSLSYMKEDPFLFKFLAYLSLFTFFMFFLVTSGNLLQLFLGWEGVGLCSYLLVGFWYHRIEANKAALKAVFMNKIGDIFLFLGIILCFYLFKSVNFSVMFSLLPFVLDETFCMFHFDIHFLTAITFCFLIAAVGKSAQLGLHTWLPDAMEGPTPVSALIHAATMVTAGIFLIIRCSHFFLYTPETNSVMVLVGLLTILFAGFVASVQYDMKKIIAYSTCSQLGFMLVSCGAGSYVDALIHLAGHAFFKAALFLGAGFIIYSLHDEQDMRKMGNLDSVNSPYFRLVYLCMVVASLGLMGFVGFTGFYTKDPIVFSLLNSSWGSSNSLTFYYEVLLNIGLGLTSYYSIRLLCLVFLGNKSRIPQQHFSNLALNSKTGDHANLTFCIVTLTTLSVFFGVFFKFFFVMGFEFLFLDYGERSDYILGVVFEKLALGWYNIMYNISVSAHILPNSLFGFFSLLEVDHYFLDQYSNRYFFGSGGYLYGDYLGSMYVVPEIPVFLYPIFYATLGMVLGFFFNATRLGFSFYDFFFSPLTTLLARWRLALPHFTKGVTGFSVYLKKYTSLYREVFSLISRIILTDFTLFSMVYILIQGLIRFLYYFLLVCDFYFTFVLSSLSFVLLPSSQPHLTHYTTGKGLRSLSLSKNTPKSGRFFWVPSFQETVLPLLSQVHLSGYNYYRYLIESNFQLKRLQTLDYSLSDYSGRDKAVTGDYLFTLPLSDVTEPRRLDSGGWSFSCIGDYFNYASFDGMGVGTKSKSKITQEGLSSVVCSNAYPLNAQTSRAFRRSRSFLFTLLNSLFSKCRRFILDLLSFFKFYLEVFWFILDKLFLLFYMVYVLIFKYAIARLLFYSLNYIKKNFMQVYLVEPLKGFLFYLDGLFHRFFFFLAYCKGHSSSLVRFFGSVVGMFSKFVHFLFFFNVWLLSSIPGISSYVFFPSFDPRGVNPVKASFYAVRNYSLSGSVYVFFGHIYSALPSFRCVILPDESSLSTLGFSLLNGSYLSHKEFSVRLAQLRDLISFSLGVRAASDLFVLGGASISFFHDKIFILIRILLKDIPFYVASFWRLPGRTSCRVSARIHSALDGFNLNIAYFLDLLLTPFVYFFILLIVVLVSVLVVGTITAPLINFFFILVTLCYGFSSLPLIRLAHNLPFTSLVNCIAWVNLYLAKFVLYLLVILRWVVSFCFLPFNITYVQPIFNTLVLHLVSLLGIAQHWFYQGILFRSEERSVPFSSSLLGFLSSVNTSSDFSRQYTTIQEQCKGGLTNFFLCIFSLLGKVFLCVYSAVVAFFLGLHKLFAYRFYFDKFYNIIGYFFLNLGFYVTFKQLDKGLFERFGPTGVVSLLYNLANSSIRFHNGSLSRYLKVVFYSLFFIIFLFIILL